jgi:hypothetical protein
MTATILMVSPSVLSRKESDGHGSITLTPLRCATLTLAAVMIPKSANANSAAPTPGPLRSSACIGTIIIS